MNYLITYEPSQTIIFKPDAIHETIIKMEGVTNWWHYISNVYIIATTKDEKFIADNIISKHPGLNFLVVDVNLEKYNGVLPKNAWEWINKKTKTLLKLKLKPAPQLQPKLLSDILNVQLQKEKTPAELFVEGLLKAQKKK